MHTFTLHILDERYSVPTLHFLLCDTEDEARQKALRYLGDSSYHTAAEVFLGVNRLFALSRADLTVESPRDSAYPDGHAGPHESPTFPSRGR